MRAKTSVLLSKMRIVIKNKHGGKIKHHDKLSIVGKTKPISSKASKNKHQKN